MPPCLATCQRLSGSLRVGRGLSRVCPRLGKKERASRVRVACVLRHSNELNECSIERPLFRLRVWVFCVFWGVDLDIKTGLITTTCCKFGPFRER